LLKSFSPKNFEPKTLGCGDDDFEEEQQVNFGKKSQITDQLVELPIEHQIYDMIDAAGSEGMTVMEVCAIIYFLRLIHIGVATKVYLLAFGNISSIGC
jgi:hypothetical protein